MHLSILNTNDSSLTLILVPSFKLYTFVNQSSTPSNTLACNEKDHLPLTFHLSLKLFPSQIQGQWVHFCLPPKSITATVFYLPYSNPSWLHRWCSWETRTATCQWASSLGRRPRTAGGSPRPGSASTGDTGPTGAGCSVSWNHVELTD